ncbi:MAG: type III-A CRISPR-associated RAMP protein Csm3 [Candidatus Brocadiales bacterium]
MKLVKYKTIKGIIRCETGLHIGGTAKELEIGGTDLPVIKHPISGEPYIPGSSLKGKMRSQLEKEEGKIQNNGEPCGCASTDCLICRIFGPHKKAQHDLGPTRIFFRDAFFNEGTREEFKKAREKGRPYIEEKTENIINRRTGTAQHPRTQERVPSGAEFDLEIVLQFFEKDNEKEIEDFVKRGLKSIKQSYLGGSGSRGYGKVTFHDLTLDGQPVEL